MAPKSSSYQSFVDSAAEANATPTTSNYDDYSTKLWGNGGQITFPEEAAKNPARDNDDGMNPGQRFIAYSKQLAEAISLTDNAKIENDPAGHGLKALIKRYSNETPAPDQVVQLTQSIIDKHGAGASFGAKVMNSEEDKERMQNYVAVAKQYMENLDLYFIKGKDGKEIAVVMGANADDFNAVIKAEQTKAVLEQKVNDARMAMNGQAQSKEQEPTQTPQAKAQESEQTIIPNVDWKKLADSLKPNAPDPDKVASLSPQHVPVNPQLQQEKEASKGVAA